MFRLMGIVISIERLRVSFVFFTHLALRNIILSWKGFNKRQISNATYILRDLARSNNFTDPIQYGK